MLNKITFYLIYRKTPLLVPVMGSLSNVIHFGKIKFVIEIKNLYHKEKTGDSKTVFI